MLHKLVAVCALLMLAVTSAAAQDVPNPPLDDTPFEERIYEVFVPERDEDDDSAMPVLIVLHGASGTGSGARAWFAFDDYAQEAGFIVVYPTGIASNWDFGGGIRTRTSIFRSDDVAYLVWLVDQLAAEFPIDREQVYATGFSNGAQMAYYLACRAPETFAAVAGVAAPLSGATAAGCAEATTPVLMIMGTLDPILSWQPQRTASGQIVNLGANGSVAFWSQRSQCNEAEDAVTIEDLPDTDTEDRSTVRRIGLTDCADGAQVQFYGVIGGGHTWPGHPITVEIELGATNLDIDATQIIMDWLVQLSEPEAVQSDA
jgi:polyhydroxybutyrate depolymerase